MGNGLVDSPKQRAEPGTTLNLQATSAPNPRAVAVLERESAMCERTWTGMKS